MLQRQIMFKQMQELRRRQQLQELGDARNQNYANQMSSLKQTPGDQFYSMNNGLLHDSSQNFALGNVNFMQHGGSPSVQGFPRELVLSQNQNQGGSPLGLFQQQFDPSLYGNPAANPDNNLNQYFHPQGASNDTANLSTKNSSNLLGMSNMQQSGYGNSFVGQESNFSSAQIGMPDGAPNQMFQEKNFFGQASIQGFNNNNLSGNHYQQGNALQRTASLLDSDRRNEQAGWAGLSPDNGPKLGLSQPTASLDPLEQKILYNTDDNSWESSFGRQTNLSIGGSKSQLENTSYADVFSSMQSGSWSALMQSAVAETSSSDTGMQEEWSGLSFQNPDFSTENQPSKYIDAGKQEYNRVDSNALNVSSPNPNENSNINYMFPGFQQQVQNYPDQTLSRPKPSHAPIQQSPGDTAKWSEYNPQQKHPMEGEMFQTFSPSPNVWSTQHHGHLKRDDNQPRVSLHNNGSQPDYSLQGHPMRGGSLFQGSAPQHVAGSGQKSLEQDQRYSVEPDRIAGNNIQQGTVHFAGSSELRSPNMTARTSESMLNLLNKDDISLEPTPGMHFSSKVSTPSEEPLTETSMSSLAKSFNISSGSQGFGLRLGPAYQQTPQSYPFFQPLPMGNSSSGSPSSPNVNDPLQTHHTPSASLPSHMAREHPAYPGAISQENSHLRSSHAYGQESRSLEIAPVTQPSLTSGGSQQIPNMWPGITNQQQVSASVPQKPRPNLFQSPNSANNSLKTMVGATEEQQHNQNSLIRENNIQEYGAYSSDEQKLVKETHQKEGSNETINLLSQKESPNEQASFGKHHLQADASASGSLISETPQQLFNITGQRQNQTPGFPSRDVGNLDHSTRPSRALAQNYSLLHQVQSGNMEIDPSKRLQVRYDGVGSAINYQQNTADAKPVVSYGEKSGVKEMVSQVNAFSPGDNNLQNISQEAQGDQSGIASSQALLRDSRQTDVSSQVDSRQGPSVSSNETSNVAYQSQISLQMAPSWFKHYGTLKNGQMFPMNDPKAALIAPQQCSGSIPGNLQANTSILQLNSANTIGKSSIWPTTVATSLPSKQMPPFNLVPSDPTCPEPIISKAKKRKVAAFDFIPWHREITQQSRRSHNISEAELEWARASNRIVEELKEDAEIVEDVLPVVRAKRRLVLTTQLMQQVFRPAPAAILNADVRSNCGFLAYFAARLALGDTCSLTIKSDTPADGNDVLHEKQKFAKRTGARDFSTIVEGFISQVKKLEGDLSRLDKCLSVVDIKVETQEAEKYAVINRFAKFHSRGHVGGADPSSSGTTPNVQKIHPQRYVVALPMPQIVPDAANCLSL